MFYNLFLLLTFSLSIFVAYFTFRFFRLQGIVASMSRIPTFRRRFKNLVKVLYIEALQASASASQEKDSIGRNEDGSIVIDEP